ncbi:MAG TPA: hypothetical protein VD864_09255, partial [Nocardioides sp.]|nr:hypothetical protein [Nocardioides sp.]
MRLGHAVSVGLLSLAVAVGLAPPAPAAPAPRAAPSELSIQADPAYADTETRVRVRLTGAGGEPVAGAQVTLERSTSGAWTPIATLTTGEDGWAAQPVTLSRVPADNVFRATFAGDGTHDAATRQARAELKRRTSRVVVGGPEKVVDGRSVAVTVRWTTSGGTPVAGKVRLYRSLGGGAWRLLRTLGTGDDGRARISTTPRQDSRWRAQAVRQAWVEGDRSPVHR